VPGPMAPRSAYATMPRSHVRVCLEIAIEEGCLEKTGCAERRRVQPGSYTDSRADVDEA